MQRGDLDNSKILFETGLSVAPNDAKGHFYYGELLSRQGQSDLADQQYAIAAKLGGTGPIVDKAKAKLPSTYHVRPGDTVFSIAVEHGFNYRDIIAYNHLDISPGVSQVNLPGTLLIPPSGYSYTGSGF
ncbi:LysM peptidoglycan-binding domain-containing protein [Paraburkholderia strydomiana]|uniref:LysM peptidoglycan-binding domain-containing protein n=1 Tax=Paraburkholderia strydomiana TaxID=1245417 RepID=UPI00286657F6|nr:LysM peptidoglycan-binding domain-containing protein [Paraburkholderia strydomiana]MDR7009889.1 LysM repeat protein [Paraburkholderia strydomiana]